MNATDRDLSAARAFHAVISYASFRDQAGRPESGMGTLPDLEPDI